MKKLIVFILFLFTQKAWAQIIPFSAIAKTNGIVTVFIEDLYGTDTNDRPYRNSFKGRIQNNGSKASITQTGFVIRLNDGIDPNIQNDRVVPVSSGLSEYSATIGGFSEQHLNATGYLVRAYAINSFGQISYSNSLYIEVPPNYCMINPCYNSGSCSNGSDGPICTCQQSYCGDCCALRSDPVDCPGGQEQTCSRFLIAQNYTSFKAQYFNKVIQPTKVPSIWESAKISISFTAIETTSK